MGLFFKNRFLRVYLGVLIVLIAKASYARQAVECSYPGHPESQFVASTQNVSEYMDHGYSCRLIEVQEVTQSQGRSPAYVFTANTKSGLSYQQCVEKIRASTGPMSQDVVQCYRRVAPEVLRGKPLRPEHANLLSLRLSADHIFFDEPASPRALVTSSSENSNVVSTQIAEVKTCLQVKENTLQAVRSSSNERLKELKDLIFAYRSKFAVADQPERERISDQLNQQIVSLIGAVAKVNRCSLGSRRSFLGQNPSTGERARARLSVKGSGKFNFIDEVLAEAQKVTEQRRIARSAE